MDVYLCFSSSKSALREGGAYDLRLVTKSVEAAFAGDWARGRWAHILKLKGGISPVTFWVSTDGGWCWNRPVHDGLPAVLGGGGR